MNSITDTHALIWWFIDSPRISAAAANIFKKCEKGQCVIFIPTIVIAEALSIFDKKRVSFNFKELFKQIKQSENFILIGLDEPILEEMFELTDIPELHDKIIASTARYLNLPIITKDAILHSHQSIDTIW